MAVLFCCRPDTFWGFLHELLVIFSMRCLRFYHACAVPSPECLIIVQLVLSTARVTILLLLLLMMRTSATVVGCDNHSSHTDDIISWPPSSCWVPLLVAGWHLHQWHA
jgi:hypothetical protein